MDHGRLVYVACFIAWLAVLTRWRRPAWLLGGSILGTAYLWAITNLPLGRIYALGVGFDRLNNLALSTPVADGSPFYQTHQVGQLNFEPFWSLLVGALSLGSPDRVLAIYPHLALWVLVAVAVSFYLGLRPTRGSTDVDGQPGSGWERGFAVFSLLMLSTSPGDPEAPYRSTWVVAFMLKPNHTLGLVLVPCVLAAMARLESGWGRLATGLLLHLLGWVFVLHWAYVSAALVLHALFDGLLRRASWKRAAIDVGTVLGVNLLLVSPYLYMLFAGYPFTVRHPSLALPSKTAHLLQLSFDQGVVLVLALYGGRVLYRRGDTASRLWLSLWLSGFLLWLGYFPLSWAGAVREPDELYFFMRVLSGALAGIGAWQIACRAGRRLRMPSAYTPAALLTLLFPLALPSWWDPAEMDPYYAGSLEPLPGSLVRTMDFVRHHTESRTAFVVGREYGRYVAALGGRRVLLDKNIHAPGDADTRSKLQTELLVEGSEAAAQDLALRYEVRYLLLDASLLEEYGGLDAAELLARPAWTTLLDTRGGEEPWFAVVRISD